MTPFSAKKTTSRRGGRLGRAAPAETRRWITTQKTHNTTTQSPYPRRSLPRSAALGGVFPARSRLNRAEDRPSSPRSVPGSLRHKFLREPFAAFCAPAEAALGEHSLCAKVHPPAPIPADRVDAAGRRRAEEEDRRPADRGEVEGAGGFPRQATFVALPSRPKRAKKYTSPSREDTRKHTAHSTHAQARGESSTHDACLESRRVRAHVPKAALLRWTKDKADFSKKERKEGAIYARPKTARVHLFLPEQSQLGAPLHLTLFPFFKLKEQINGTLNLAE